MKCGVCWEDESIAWECSHPGCEHAMCAGCAESYWCGDDVCDAVCLDRAHRVPWDHVLEALPKKGVRNLVSAMAKRTFDEQGARFNSMICACAIDGDVSAHVCRDEDRLSVEEIYSSCTSCPACAAPIYKTEGCDHMFCTVCKTSYNMPDMRTMHNAFGNPHFDQYVSTLASNDRSGVMGDIELYGAPGAASTRRCAR